MIRNPGMGHNNPPADVVPMDIASARLKASRTTALGLSGDFSAEKAAATARDHFAEAAKLNRQKQEEIRRALDQLHQIFVACMMIPEQEQTLRAACNRENIPLRKWDIAIAVVRFYGKIGENKKIGENEKINRYANVLKEAHLRKIPPSALAEYLAKPGQGIEKLHKAYQRRQNDGVDDDLPDNLQTGTRHKPALKRKKKRKTSSEQGPKPLNLTWAGKRLDRYTSAKPKSRWWILVEKIDNRSAEIRLVKIKRPVV